MIRPGLKLFYSLIFSFLLLQTLSAQTRTQALALGKKRNAIIQLGEIQRYTVQLQKGQFAVLLLQQQGIDVRAQTFTPDGKLLHDFDTPDKKVGPEIIVIDGWEGGTYQLEVRPVGKKRRIKQGNYTIKLEGINSDLNAQLEQALYLISKERHIPGFAVSVVDGNGVLFKKGFGYANLAQGTPYTTETIQNIGSISKTLIGLSLMKLVEQGKLSLETPINEVLPFEVINPHYPEIPITIKHLANQTSTIKETKDYERSYLLTEQVQLDRHGFHRSEYKNFKAASEHDKMPMDSFLFNIVAKEGEWYRKRNFLKIPPGTAFHYTNVGSTLAAYIVELVSGQGFDAFTQQHILSPLGLKASGWSFDQVDLAQHATLYGIYKKPFPKYTLITYPDGGLITSTSDLSRYLVELIKGYNGKSKLLSAASFQEMMVKQQFKEEGSGYGIFWEETTDKRLGHNGGDPGIVSMMYYNPKTKIGTTFLANVLPASPETRLQFIRIIRMLRHYERHFN
ncbi:MAG: serine hydrolase [Bacteroidota bacterium]